MKKIELFRLLDDHTWDTFVASVPAKATTRAIGRFISEELVPQAQHRRAVLIGIYNDCLEQTDPDDPRLHD